MRKIVVNGVKAKPNAKCLDPYLQGLVLMLNFFAPGITTVWSVPKVIIIKNLANG